MCDIGKNPSISSNNNSRGSKVSRDSKVPNENVPNENVHSESIVPQLTWNHKVNSSIHKCRDERYHLFFKVFGKTFLDFIRPFLETDYRKNMEIEIKNRLVSFGATQIEKLLFDHIYTNFLGKKQSEFCYNYCFKLALDALHNNPQYFSVEKNPNLPFKIRFFLSVFNLYLAERRHSCEHREATKVFQFGLLRTNKTLVDSLFGDQPKVAYTNLTGPYYKARVLLEKNKSLVRGSTEASKLFNFLYYGLFGSCEHFYMEYKDSDGHIYPVASFVFIKKEQVLTEKAKVFLGIGKDESENSSLTFFGDDDTAAIYIHPTLEMLRVIIPLLDNLFLSALANSSENNVDMIAEWFQLNVWASITLRGSGTESLIGAEFLLNAVGLTSGPYFDGESPIITALTTDLKTFQSSFSKLMSIKKCNDETNNKVLSQDLSDKYKKYFKLIFRQDLPHNFFLGEDDDDDFPWVPLDPL